MKSKCPHPGQRDLRDPPDRSRVEALRVKGKHRRKKLTRVALPASSNAPAPAEQTLSASGDVEREAPPDAERGGHDVERD